MSTLGARRISILSLTIPPSGAWVGEATLDSGEPPTAGAATLTIGDLVLACRVLLGRGGLDSPDSPHVVLAGGYGWLKPLPAGSYTSPNGLRLSTVLSALAGLTGERVGPVVEVKVGVDFGWPAGSTGADVLAGLVDRGLLPSWRVRPDGLTVFTPWPAIGAADTFGVIVDRDLARGQRFIALDSRIAAWLPGATVQSTRIARVQIDERNSETREVVNDS